MVSPERPDRRADDRTSAAVEIRGLSYRYPGASRAALERVDLSISAGEKIAIVGPNGAGKTTLLLHLNGILEPAVGSVRIGGTPIGPEHLEEVRQRVGLVFQDPDDQLFMPTLLEDVAFGPLCRGLSRAEAESRARRALRAVGLEIVDPNRPGHHMSGGEKRRAALATVLSVDPEVLALDEPAAGMDGRGRRQIARLLMERDQTVVVVTHDVEFAAAVCPRMVIMEGGVIRADDRSTEILADTALLSNHGLEAPGSLLRDLADRPARDPVRGAGP